MQNNKFLFFRDQIPDEYGQQFYIAAEKAMLNFQREFIFMKILGYTEKDYRHILEFVYNDHPELFYCYPLKSVIKIELFQVKVTLGYIDNNAEAQRKARELNNTVESIVREIFPHGYETVDDLVREKGIFDWITKKVTYDQISLDSLKPDRSNMSDAWNAYGTLVKRTAVCHGISLAFKLLCDRVNLPSIVVLGDAGGRHAWNIVKIHDRFYHIDCTWGLKTSIDMKNPMKKYQYLNVPDLVMFRDHKPEVDYLPKCKSLRYNPYKQRNLCVTNEEELCLLAEMMFRKGNRRFAIMCINGSPEQSLLQELCLKIRNKIGSDFTYYRSNSYVAFVWE